MREEDVGGRNLGDDIRGGWYWYFFLIAIIELAVEWVFLLFFGRERRLPRAFGFLFLDFSVGFVVVRPVAEPRRPLRG